LTLDEYMNWQPTYAAYVKKKFNDKDAKAQSILEMVSEAGEVLELLTKANRKGKEIDREKIIDEIGDTFWGVAGVLNTFGITFQEMIDFNYSKLEERNKE